MKEKTRVHLLIKGRVQGVFFRALTKEKAEKLALTGWVRNTSDGKVEIVLEGEKEKIEEMLKWAKKGPAGAKVESIDIQWEEYKDEFKNFKVRRD